MGKTMDLEERMESFQGPVLYLFHHVSGAFDMAAKQ